MEDIIIDQGQGSITVEDHINDAQGNPIVDVQVCVYRKNDINTLIAQDYTDPAGRWRVYLDQGDYIFEYYHPEFHEFQENRIIR